MEQKVLITGFNGELGSKIVKKLVEHNKKVIAIDINDSQEKINSNPLRILDSKGHYPQL